MQNRWHLANSGLLRFCDWPEMKAKNKIISLMDVDEFE